MLMCMELSHNAHGIGLGLRVGWIWLGFWEYDVYGYGRKLTAGDFREECMQMDWKYVSQVRRQ